MTKGPDDRLPLEGLFPEALREQLRKAGVDIDGPGKYILDEHGEPQECRDLLEWSMWMERTRTDGTRVIAHDRDEAPGAPDVFVSTIFLGLDHKHFLDGPPILFETMVFGGLHDGYQKRYTSREEALRGHQVACALVAKDHQ